MFAVRTCEHGRPGRVLDEFDTHGEAREYAESVGNDHYFGVVIEGPEGYDHGDGVWGPYEEE